MASTLLDPSTRWTQIQDNELTINDVRNTLGSIKDDLWVVAACLDRIVDDVDVQRSLLELGLERTEKVVGRGMEVIADDDCGEEGKEMGSLGEYFKETTTDAKLTWMRALLLVRLDRLNTYVEICKDLPEDQDTPGDDEEPGEEALDEWEDDPWGGGEPPSPPRQSESLVKVKPPISLPSFLLSDLLQCSVLFISKELFHAVRILFERHTTYLWPFRYKILDAIPEYSHPAEYRDILPSLDPSDDVELTIEAKPWRSDIDWSEKSDVRAALPSSEVDFPPETTVDPFNANSKPLSAPELTNWYKSRVDNIINSTGMIDIALATIQHGGSQGIPDLDSLGEELSLLARLVYDAPQPEHDSADDWTLARWNAMDPPAVIQAYLAHTPPETVSKVVQSLVLPYLFVLESRAERAGTPDPGMHNRLLYGYILTVPLEVAAAIFEASKPTLPIAQRLIRNDEDVARLALACLYGSESRNEWSTMSRIFECLPAWDITNDADGDEADTTIASLGAFVTPSTTRPRCTANDLLVFFNPLPVSSLSRALDILDVHLEGGEILARWSVPAPLRWFLQSGGDAAEQRSWANRMARRAGGTGDQLNTKEDWVRLLDDMLKLSGSGGSRLKGAFGLLPRKEVIRIFFGGLLSTGKFDIAKDLIRSKSRLKLDNADVEEICLSASREFYDNANSGNYKFGDMKLAYECLDVPLPSDQLLKEKEFIEATSRLSSFNVMSRPGIPISPIEIRLTKDRLSLVSRVLSSNSDAYKHTQVILDLVHKLGFRNDVAAEVKTLAMLVNTALHAEDFDRAYETAEKMVNTVLQLRAEIEPGLTDPKVEEASEVCWMACWQLGRQPEFDDVDKKLLLLGRALELCPPERLYEVLTGWSRLEKEDLDSRKERLAHPDSSVAAAKLPRKRTVDLATPNTASSLTSRLQDFRMHIPASPLVNAEDAAAFAGRTFNRVTSHFPFSVGNRDHSRGSSDDRSRSREGRRRRPESGEVQAQANRVLARGIGWLIGADDE